MQTNPSSGGGANTLVLSSWRCWWLKRWLKVCTYIYHNSRLWERGKCCCLRLRQHNEGGSQESL